jgi:hypothetical protein
MLYPKEHQNSLKFAYTIFRLSTLNNYIVFQIEKSEYQQERSFGRMLIATKSTRIMIMKSHKSHRAG